MKHHCVEPGRFARQGFPEAVYCPGKTPAQILEIVRGLCTGNGPVLLTRAERAVYIRIKKEFKTAVYHPLARIIVVRSNPQHRSAERYVCVITAGTTDIAVAEEAAVTIEAMGNPVVRIYDAGVAGIHRLLEHQDTIRKATCAVVCAGMEGALASVAGGLACCPVIGVPTSVGYGAAFGGVAALLAMLNSCAPNVSVVNIDDGFGAGIIASLINAGSPSQ